MVVSSISSLLSGDEETPIHDVVFVIECTANLGAYIEALKRDYIMPALEHFSGGPPEEVDCGHDSSCTFYSLVLFYAADCVPCPTTKCLGATASTYQFLQSLNSVSFEGGGAEGCSFVAEGLSTAAQVFDDLETERGPGIQTQKHCILICNSPSYLSPSEESINYSGFTAEEMADVLAKKNVHFSIMAPRKMPEMYRLFDKASSLGGASSTVKDFTKDIRHCILLRGFQLKQRTPSPTVIDSVSCASSDTNTNQGINVLSPNAPGHPLFKVPSTQSQDPMQTGRALVNNASVKSPNPTLQVGGPSSMVQTSQMNPPTQAVSAAQEVLSQAQKQQPPKSNIVPSQSSGSVMSPMMSQSSGSAMSPMMSQSSGSAMSPMMYPIPSPQSMKSSMQQQIDSPSGQIGPQGGVNQSGMGSQQMNQPPGGSHVQNLPARGRGKIMPGQQMHSQGGQMSRGQQMQSGPGGPSAISSQQITASVSQPLMAGNSQMPGQMSGGSLGGPPMSMPGQQMSESGVQILSGPGVNQMTGQTSSVPGGQMPGLPSSMIQNPGSRLTQQLASANTNVRMPMDPNIPQPRMNFGQQPSAGPPLDTNAVMSTLENSRRSQMLAQQQTKIIWTGAIEWHEKVKATPMGESGKSVRSVACHVYSCPSSNPGEPEVDCSKWPNKLTMMHIPQSMLTPLQPMFRASKMLTFKFGNQDVEALKSLYRMMSNGFAGCIHFPAIAQCDVRVIMLLYSSRKKDFMGLIPNDQAHFLQSIKTIISNHKVKQAQQTQEKIKAMLKDPQQGMGGVQVQQGNQSMGGVQVQQGNQSQFNQPSQPMMPASINMFESSQPGQGGISVQAPSSVQAMSSQHNATIASSGQSSMAPSIQAQSNINNPGSIDQERIKNMREMEALKRSLEEKTMKEMQLRQMSAQQQMTTNQQQIPPQQRMPTQQQMPTPQQMTAQQRMQMMNQQQIQQQNQQQIRSNQMRQQQMALQQQQQHRQAVPLQQRLPIPQGMNPQGNMGQSINPQQGNLGQPPQGQGSGMMMQSMFEPDPRSDMWN